MKKQTQPERLLKRLKRKSMTTIEIINMGILNPYGVIEKLRNQGYTIETKNKAVGNMAKFFYRGPHAQ